MGNNLKLSPADKNIFAADQEIIYSDDRSQIFSGETKFFTS
jgi:hypothetical protein